MVEVQTKGRGRIRGTEGRVPVEHVSANLWNYNHQDDFMYGKQKNSLETFALSAPIIVREVASKSKKQVSEGESKMLAPEYASARIGKDEKRYEIIDGEHRYRAALELGFEEIAIWNLGDVADSEAQQLTIMFNELKGHPRVDDLGQLMKILDENVGREAIEMNLPFSPQQIDDLISTVDFDWTNFEAHEEDEETGGEKNHIVRLEFRLDEDKARIIEQALVKYGVSHRIDHNSEEGRAEAITAIAGMYLRTE